MIRNGDQYRKTLTQNMVVSGASAIIGCLITIISYPVYLHFLGYSQYGLWLMLSTFLTLCQLGNLGIAPALSKLIAEDIGQSDAAGAQCYVELGITFVAALSTTILAILLLSRNNILKLLHLSPTTAATLHSLLPIVLLLTFYAFLNDVFSAVLIGLGRTDVSSAIQTISQMLAFASSFVLLKFGQGVRALALGALVSLTFTQVMATIFSKRFGGLILKPGLHVDRFRVRKLLGLSSTVFASSLAAAVFVPLNKIVLSKYVGLSAVPLYDMAFNISMRVRGLFEMPLRPIMPALSHAVSAREEDLRSAVGGISKHANRLLLIAGITFSTLFVLANPVLRVWLRRSFEPSLTGSLRVALIGAFISLLGVPAYYSLLGVGKASTLFWSHILQSSTNVAIVVVTFIVGHPLSAISLLGASSIAMTASSCFLIARYASTVKSLTHREQVVYRRHQPAESVLAIADPPLSHADEA